MFSKTYPNLGEIVQIHLRVEATAPIQRVLLADLPDGEQSFLRWSGWNAPAHLQTWSVDLPIRMPTTHYRFLLQAADGFGGIQLPDRLPMNRWTRWIFKSWPLQSARLGARQRFLPDLPGPLRQWRPWQ